MKRILCLTLIALTTGLFSAGAFAAPPGVVDVGKKVFQFNLIGFPDHNVYNGNCGHGNRIFVNRGDHHAHIRIVDDNDGWYVSDCDATGGSTGEFHSDDVGSYLVFARILGKPGGELDICADVVSDHDDHLCLLGTFNMKREGGKSNFSIVPSSMFDAELEDIMWSLDVNHNFRIAQFRVYEAL
jgi:hypothetical protein